MRIALLAPPWYPVPPTAYGGIEAVVATLAGSLADLGHTVAVVGAGPVAIPGVEGITTLARPYPDLIGTESIAVAHGLLARDALAAWRPDVVHDHTLIGAVLRDLLDAPVLTTIHGPVDPVCRIIFSSPGSRLAAISASSRASAPDLPWHATVHNGLDLTGFPFRADKDDYALFLGRLSPDKGVVQAIEVARAAGVRLVLAGKCSEPPERRFFDEHVRPLLGDDVTWVGEVGGTAKTDLLAGARCLLFPLQWEEPFGLVMIEAMACGTPVLSLARGAVPEVVVDGVTGRVAATEAELVDELRAGVRYDPAACRAHALTEFSPQRMAQRYVAAYRGLVEEHRLAVHGGDGATAPPVRLVPARQDTLVLRPGPRPPGSTAPRAAAGSG